MNQNPTSNPPIGVQRIQISGPTGTATADVSGSLDIGRTDGGVVLPDPKMSGRHLRLTTALDSDGSSVVLVVEDLQSTNGTFVDGVRISAPTAVRPGQSVAFGDSTLSLIPAAAAGPAGRTAPPGSPAPSPSPVSGAPTPPAPGAQTLTAPQLTSIRTDAIEVRFVSGSYGEAAAGAYADAAAKARTSLRGFGSEPSGVVPVVDLVDPYENGGEIISHGTIVDAPGARAWVIATPESPPEAPHRMMALVFGAQLPAADRVSILVEGYGLLRSGAQSANEALGELELPRLEDSEGELRSAMTLSFVRDLVEREGDDALLNVLAAPANTLDEMIRETYGASLIQLERRWRRQLAAGEPEVKVLDFARLSLRYLRPYKMRQAEIFLYMLLSLAFVASFPFVTQRLFDSALPSGNFSEVVTLLAILGGAFVVSLIAGLRQAYQTAWVTTAVTRDLRQAIFDKIQTLPDTWFDDHPQGEVMSRLFDDVGEVEEGLTQAVGQGIFQTISLLVSAVIMMTINPLLGVIVLIGAPLVGLVYKAMAQGALDRSIRVQEGSGALYSVAGENYRANAVVKVFGLAGRETRRFSKQSDRLFDATRRMALWGGVFGLSVNLIVTVLRLGVLGFGAWLILEGRFTIGGLVAFLSIMGEVISPVTVLVTLSQSVQASMGSLIRINDVIDAEPEPDDEGLPPMAPLTTSLRLSNLSMSYTPERRALDGFDVDIPVGTRVAFVGPSGSGKSTVLRLLMRLHEPDEGGILVDGVDIRHGSLGSWRDQLGVVFQDSFLFDASVRENIALGRPGCSDEEVLAAAQAAEVDTFIDSLAHGWDSLVGEGGSNLSGGQRQRVAIARALIRNPRLLVLDEATSALDPATERQINDTISSVAHGRTVVSVTHRLASISDYDMIVVIDEGHLVEQGRHDDLLARRGLYARLWAEQTGTPMPEAPDFDVIGALRRIGLFAGVSDADLALAAERLTPRSLGAGRALADGDGLVVVVDGTGTVRTAADDTGSEIAHLRAGDAFGVASALGGHMATWLHADEPMSLLHMSSSDVAALRRTVTSERQVAPDRRPPASATRLTQSLHRRDLGTVNVASRLAPMVAADPSNRPTIVHGLRARS